MSAAATDQPGFLFVSERADPAQLDDTATTATEAGQVFAALERELRRSGLEFHDILRTRLLYATRADYPEMNEVRDPLFRARFPKGDFPAASGVVTGGLGGVRPNFDLEVIAHPGKRALNAIGVIQEWSGVRPPFTHANIAGGVLFASGQGPYDDSGGLAAADPIGQTVVALGALDKVLQAAGRSCSDILCLTAYLSPRAILDKDPIVAEIEAFIRKADDDVPPIINVIGVAQLFKPGMEIAMELCARASPANPATFISADSAQATRHERFLIARSEATGKDKPTASFDIAFANLRDALDGVDAKPHDIGLLTVWFSSTHDQRELEILARQAVGSDAALTLVPMSSAGIFLEAMGSLPQRQSAE